MSVEARRRAADGASNALQSHQRQASRLLLCTPAAGHPVAAADIAIDVTRACAV